MDVASAVLEAAVEHNLPILGVCFGHQLLARTLGGKVETNPAGREMGTVEVVVTKPGSTDAVIGPFFPSFRVQATHEDAVVEPPAGAVVLARTAQDDCAAFRVGERIYGVQFHPEMNGAIMRRCINHRARVIDAERGPGTARRLYDNVVDVREGTLILQRFIQEVVVPASRRRSRPARKKTSATPKARGLYQESFAPCPDGADIYYNRIGVGEPALVMCAGIGCDQYAWKHLVPALRHHHTILRWNYPGHGKTPPPPRWMTEPNPRLSIEGMADDAVRVMDHAGLERAVLFGHSMGVQVVLEAWHRHPSRVQAMVLICGSYGRPLSTFHGTAVVEKALPMLRTVVRTFPDAARRLWQGVLTHDISYHYAVHLEVNGRLVKKPDFKPYFTDIARVDPVLFVEMLGHAGNHSAEPYLGEINVPTLIVAGEKDTFTPHWLSQYMHRAIPRSEILTVPTGTHTAPIEIPELVSLRVEKFLATHFPPARGRMSGPTNAAS